MDEISQFFSYFYKNFTLIPTHHSGFPDAGQHIKTFGCNSNQLNEIPYFDNQLIFKLEKVIKESLFTYC